jgi:hypothetical protein
MNTRTLNQRLPLGALALLLAAMLLSLLGCALLGSDLGTLLSGLTHPSVAPAPTATATPWRGSPHTTPPGWHVYHAVGFALALPADWKVYVDVSFSNEFLTPVIGYSLQTQQGIHRASVLVWDHLTPAQVRDDACASVSQQTPVTFAGLPMRYTTGDGSAAPDERIWTFVSGRGIVSQLWTDDAGYDSAGRRENRAVLETFAPADTTWGCA